MRRCGAFVTGTGDLSWLTRNNGVQSSNQRTIRARDDAAKCRRDWIKDGCRLVINMIPAMAV